MKKTIALMICCATIGLSACGDTWKTNPDPRFNHPIKVEQTSRGISFSMVGPNYQISPSILAAFTDDYIKRGHGPLLVRATNKGQEAIKDKLLQAGVRSDQILWDVSDAPLDKIILRFDAFKAIPPECGKFDSDKEFLNAPYYNRPSTNFGCSFYRNLGLMISDPADLQHMRAPLAPGSGEFASDRIGDYNKYTAPAAPTANVGSGGQ